MAKLEEKLKYNPVTRRDIDDFADEVEARYASLSVATDNEHIIFRCNDQLTLDKAVNEATNFINYYGMK